MKSNFELGGLSAKWDENFTYERKFVELVQIREPAFVCFVWDECSYSLHSLHACQLKELKYSRTIEICPQMVAF